jgi:hypothetical protein
MNTDLAVTELEEQAEEIIEIVQDYIGSDGMIMDYIIVKQRLIDYLDKIKESD